MSDTKDLLFREARSHNKWLEKPVTEEQVHELYELAKMGPTAFNGCPARFVFCHSQDARDKLAGCVMEGNIDKVQTAPLVVVVAMDLQFHDKLPQLWPQNPDVKDYYSEPAAAEKTAVRNGTLQGAYLMMAARAMGLDCGPMSGFDMNKVNEAFLSGTSWKANFLCAIGYGDESGLFPRGPRLPFDEACQLV